MNPDTFGQYELLHRIAHGGMAEIFLAKRRGPGGFDKRVVIKRVLPHLSENQDFVQMFLDEARLASQLNHPNIVQIFDFGVIHKTYFLCMEHLDGEDFATVLRILRDRGEPISPQVAAIVLSAACDGMHYAHTFIDEDGRALKIVHRDLSPSNLFLTTQGAVKVLDFGVAKMEGKMVETQSGVVKGKFAYLSPEQARGHDLDQRSDVFALGLILHEALTGVKVFKRNSEAATLHAVLEEPIQNPCKLRPELPEEVGRIAMKALARSPVDRWPTAQAMRSALDEFLSARGSVPASAQLQAFMQSVVGQARHRESAPTPMEDQLGSVLPPGTGVDARLDRITAAFPGSEQEVTSVERTPSLLVPDARGRPRSVAEREPSARRTRTRRTLPFFVTLVLGAVVVTGGWWMAQTGAPVEEAEEGPESESEVGLATEAEIDPDAGSAGEESAALAGDSAALAVAGRSAAGRTAAGLTVGQAVSRKGRKGRKGQTRTGRKGKTTGQIVAVTPPVTAPVTPPEVTPPPASGKLDVNCSPFCRIWIDGKDTGETSPIQGLELSVGTHLVKLVNPPTQLTREKKIVIEAGETRRLTIDF